MAKRRTRKKSRKKGRLRRWLGPVLKWGLRGFAAITLLLALVMGLYRLINPPTTPYMFAEQRRLGGVQRDWVPLERIAPALARAVVAAEDANFCLHWGFDLPAIRDAIDDGGTRGASTISQQTVKNVFLWHGRTYTRKALEALMTPALEAVWPKTRILEVYLNVAEFDTGVFGVEAAAQHYFGLSAADLSDVQAARLAAILPDPKGRSAADPSDFVRNRARSILSGEATIDRDGRANCFQS
ncbi:MAG: monofunctional biosynthetic peptidoglycan transglycosylase [Pseudomonadota bacterium]